MQKKPQIVVADWMTVRDPCKTKQNDAIIFSELKKREESKGNQSNVTATGGGNQSNVIAMTDAELTRCCLNKMILKKRYTHRHLLLVIMCVLLTLWIVHENTGQQVQKRWIFVITPTYERLEQKAALTSLSQTLQLIDKVHWIVVEDSEKRSAKIEKFLRNCKLIFTHLSILTPKMSKALCCARKSEKFQRNHAINWLRTKYGNSKDVSGVVYFADDDNIYDIRLFDNYVRNVKSVGIWPVAFVGGAIVETPLVTNDIVTGWNVRFNPKRKFATDMAGFAVNLKLFLKTEADFSNIVDGTMVIAVLSRVFSKS